MLKKYFYLILFSFLYSEMIEHLQVYESYEDQNIKVEVLINEKYSNIKNITLNYRSKNQVNYLQISMTHDRDNFFYAYIPRNYVTKNGIEYYILLELNNNKVYSFPDKNPKTDPISIKVKVINKDKGKKSKLQNKKIQILSPLPNSRVFKNDLLISLSYFKLRNIDNNKTKVLLNGRDITEKITFYDNYFIYKPKFILEGRYNVDVIFFDKYGRELPVFNWSFTVLSQDKLKGLSTLFNHTGKITNNYSINNTDSENLAINNLNIDYRVNLDFIKVRNKFKISSTSNEFEQDNNRYLVALKAPYIDLHLGDSYPFINQYALNGYRVRGFNLKVDLNFLDAHIVQGELARSITGNPNNNALVISDITKF